MKKSVMTRTFRIIDIDGEVLIEYATRKEMLSWLTDYIDNVNNGYYSSEEVYMILYKDGTTDYIDEGYDGHKIRKTHIASIVNCNPSSYMVYGHFEMNEWGVCYPSFEDEISEENIEEIEETEETAETVENVEETIEEPQQEVSETTETKETVEITEEASTDVFQYEIRFHIADCKECYPHWDTMSVNADCISNARYNAVKRIDNEFDYPFSAVDVIEIYTSAGKLVNQEFM